MALKAGMNIRWSKPRSINGTDDIALSFYPVQDVANDRPALAFSYCMTAKDPVIVDLIDDSVFLPQFDPGVHIGDQGLFVTREDIG